MNNHFLSGLLVLLSFSLCLAQTAPTNTPASSFGTGIEGSITIGPVHAGPIREGTPDSKPLPNEKFVVQKEGTGSPVVSFTTDAQGHFSVSLPPGRYTVTKEGGKRGIGRFGPFEAEVSAGKMTSVQWNCDSGMR